MAASDDIEFWEVPRLWPGETVAIVAGGPNLTLDQVEHVRDRCRVIAINRAFEWAPWADWIYGCDIERFWQWYPDALKCAGLKIAVRAIHKARESSLYVKQMRDLHRDGVRILRHTTRENVKGRPIHEGLSDDPGVVHGNCSAWQVLSIIAHTGARRVLLLGIEMRGGHWHNGYDDRTAEPNYNLVVQSGESFVAPLADLGIEVVNCSPDSAVPYWSRMPVQEALA